MTRENESDEEIKGVTGWFRKIRETWENKKENKKIEGVNREERRKGGRGNSGWLQGKIFYFSKLL